AELSGDKKYNDAGRFSWETVTANRSLAVGGNSRRDHFPSVASCGDYINDVDGPESCNSYNMLKLTEDLFRMQPSAHYADYYERTVFNHILSSQHPEHGGYVYFTSARPRHYRVYSAPNEAMWCCVGTGMENHGKYNHFIYTRSADSMFLNLFIASELNWKDKKVSIKQETNFPYEERTKLTVTKGSSSFKLMVRYPEWVKKGALKISVNGKAVSYSVLPSSYICIDRKWEKGDVIEVELPMHIIVERLPNVPDYIAFMHGPILLGAKTGTDDLRGLIADDGRWGQYPSGKMLPVDQAPILVEDDIRNIAGKLVPIKDEPLHFRLNVKMENPMDVKLEPFSHIHDARYMIYWLALTNNGYKSYMDSLSIVEKAKIALEKRTIDFVASGEQQPETDHAMHKENSNTGNTNHEFYRDASRGGYFSYETKTNSQTDLSLMVRYWGAEWGGRKFEIYIDDEKLVTEDNTGRWNQSKFHNVEYAIPNSMVKDKNSIRVKFQSIQGNTAGAVYYIRLLKAKQN
ncbi:MAG TPA: beta-L-arabinofuranosidase domain-containing protein, partial [Prolixibacteraceae bacterium]|nr:beta-L-arabinofuranosidase domain-containing protein [Prolixibacteraceae bacterium]